MRWKIQNWIQPVMKKEKFVNNISKLIGKSQIFAA